MPLSAKVDTDTETQLTAHSSPQPVCQVAKSAAVGQMDAGLFARVRCVAWKQTQFTRLTLGSWFA